LRFNYQLSGIDVWIRYYAPAGKQLLYHFYITRGTFEEIVKTKSVEIAYPHTEIVYKKE